VNTNEERKIDPNAPILEKTGAVLTNIWSKTVSGLDKGIDFTVTKSKDLGQKWDSSETGAKVNAGTKVAVDKTKEISVKAWGATVEGFVKVKNSETV